MIFIDGLEKYKIITYFYSKKATRVLIKNMFKKNDKLKFNCVEFIISFV